MIIRKIRPHIEFVGVSSYHNDSGSVNDTNLQLSLPSGTRTGDYALFWYAKNNGSANVAFPSGFTQLVSDVARLSATNGENYRVGCAAKVLDATDISNGFVTQPDVQIVSTIAMPVFRNRTATVMTTGNFTRTASLAANTVALESETSTAQFSAIAVAAIFHAREKRTASISGWTQLTIDSWGGADNINRQAIRLFILEMGSGATAAGTVTISGSADLTITSQMCVVQ